MELQAFGKTNLKVTKIGLGLAALGRPGYINLGHGNDLDFHYEVEAMQENTFEVLDTAYEQGIRYLDVARSYGKGEEFLGKWLKVRNKEKEVTIGSKWGYTYTAGWEVKADKHEVKEHSLEVLNRQWPVSQQNLGGNLRIYHIHSATLESGVLENEEVLKKLWELKSSGLIIGLSLSGENQGKTLEKALTIRKGKELLFQSVQATWNILEPSASGVLMKASQEGLGVIIKEALANGRLTERNEDPGFAQKKILLQSLAQKYKVSIDALNMAYVLHQPWINVVLSGASTKVQLLSNIQAQQVTISSEDAHILQNMAETPGEYWKKRAELDWN